MTILATLVLLPGLDGTGQLFRDFIDSLGEEIEPIVLDYPADIPLGYLELESRIRALLPTDRPYFLLAESFSGPIGISIAAASPPGLNGLILSCSFAASPQRFSGIFRTLLPALPIKALPISMLGLFLFGRFWNQRNRALLKGALAAVSPEVMHSRLDSILTVNVSSKLSLIRVPILYLQALEDRVVPRRSSKLVQSLATNVEVAEFRAPHMLLQSLPKVSVTRVRDFMSQHQSS